jgi:predicted anti-sigma-YlaC factor YlaD
MTAEIGCDRSESREDTRLSTLTAAALRSPHACRRPLPGRLLLALALLAALQGCSLRQYALRQAADSLAATGASFATDDDPDLIGDAAPFSLKLMESVLAEAPRHVPLLTAASRGFTQYTFAYVQQEGEALEDTDIAAAAARFNRARALYRRARDYGLRGLEVAHPGFTGALRQDARKAAAALQRTDVALAYWTAAAWAAHIGLSKDDPGAVAQVPQMEALIDRALALDETFDAGAIHTFLIAYELSRAQRKPDPIAAARAHFDRAVALSAGELAAPYVSIAETVDVAVQDRAAFEGHLRQALAIDPDAKPQWRLANLVMQRRARWLLARAEQLIAEPVE